MRNPVPRGLRGMVRFALRFTLLMLALIVGCGEEPENLSDHSSLPIENFIQNEGLKRRDQPLDDCTEDCDDGISCTEDLCDPDDGSCRYNADDSLCIVESPCTINERCDIDLGCLVDFKDDWDTCDDNGDDGSTACFSGVCEHLGPNDTCETGIDLSVGTLYQVRLGGFHAYLDASAACGVDDLKGLDMFFSFSIEEGNAYNITLTPHEGMDLALVAWTDCEESAECLLVEDREGEGEAEQVSEFVADADGSLILQVIDITEEPEHDLERYSIYIESVPVPDGDADDVDNVDDEERQEDREWEEGDGCEHEGREEEDETGDMDNREVENESDELEEVLIGDMDDELEGGDLDVLELEDDIAEVEVSEAEEEVTEVENVIGELQTENEASVEGDDQTAGDEENTDRDGENPSQSIEGNAAGSGCRSFAGKFQFIVFISLLLFFSRRCRLERKERCTKI